MFLQSNPIKRPSISLLNIEVKKLNWKDKFKRDLYKQNLKYVQYQKQQSDIKIQQQKRVAVKCLSKLFDKQQSIFLQDDQQQYPHHGNYSSYIPLKKNQQKLNDELQNTFPYIQYLIQKDHQQTKINVYNQISNHIRSANQSEAIQIAWKSCLKKYLCQIDIIKAIQIYVQTLKYGTSILNKYHHLYGNGCDKQVFFHKVFQTAKYFKPILVINKNIKSTIQANEQITQITLPKSAKMLFCAICLLYDCNQHNIDDKVVQTNYQYVSKKNMISNQQHVSKILQLLKFLKNIEEINISIENQNGQTQFGQILEKCTDKCYKRFINKKEQYQMIKNKRRPILSPLHRSLIKMGIQLYSYEPCMIWSLLVQETKTPINLAAATCQSVFFYFIQEYNILDKLQNKLFSSEVQMLKNQSTKISNQSSSFILPPTSNRKNKKDLRFDHQDLQNYKIGICYHFFIGQSHDEDQNCEKCCCKKRGFCLPECQCSDQCQIMKKGCICKVGQCRTKKCPCFSNGQECIPSICKGCFNTQGIVNKKNSCKNAQILRGQIKHIKIGQSNIMGLGAFAGTDINKDQLVSIYTGQMIEHQIDYMRQGLRYDDTFYNFGLQQGGSIDARFIGNKSRFINHQKGGQQNLNSLTMFSQGKFKTVLYAKKNIKKNQQLFFDYDVDGTLVKNFPGKYDFIKKKNN